jgi:hypothetical protein
MVSSESTLVCWEAMNKYGNSTLTELHAPIGHARSKIDAYDDIITSDCEATIISFASVDSIALLCT